MTGKMPVPPISHRHHQIILRFGHYFWQSLCGLVFYARTDQVPAAEVAQSINRVFTFPHRIGGGVFAVCSNPAGAESALVGLSFQVTGVCPIIPHEEIRVRTASGEEYFDVQGRQDLSKNQ